MKKLIAAFVVVLVAGSVAAAYLRSRKTVQAQVLTQEITRGDVIQSVGGTGTVEAVKTVDVGTQVNGVVREIYADFNSIVRKGQLIAKIDPAAIEAQIEQSNAQLASAEANLERQRVAVEDWRRKLKRAEELLARKLITQQDLETAQVNVKTGEANVRAQLATISQIRATRRQLDVDLGYTDIYAPINGIVINRKVDVGQTVVSRNTVTSMFQIAEDLTRMQMKMNVDESDVGLLRPGQPATFRVDAYLEKEYSGTVSQVRLQPVVTQNVVTYTTIIEVPNPDLTLKPGMTANVRVEVARRENVLRVHLAAARFRATSDVFESLGLPPPPELQQRSGRGAASGGAGPALATAGRQPDAVRAVDTRTAAARRDVTTIDGLFGALAFEPLPGRVWLYSTDPATKARSLKAVNVRTGISDGTYAELLEGPGLTEGKTLMTGLDAGQRNAVPTGTNPLMPQRRGGFGGDHGPH